MRSPCCLARAATETGTAGLVAQASDRLIRAGAAFEGSAEIAEARSMARDFLTTVQAVHGLPVSARALGMVQLVVSELVTNARKYAPGPGVLDLEIVEGAVEISV